MDGHRGPVHGDVPGRLLVPVGDQGAPVRVGEAEVQHVRGPAGPRAEVAEQQPGGPVAGQHVEPGRDGVRRGWFEAVHERVQPGTGRGERTVRPATSLVVEVAGEGEQVLALVGVEPERIRDRRQHAGRGPGLAALFQPRVPGQAHVGELGDLLPAQARDPAHPPVGQPHIGRAQPGATGAQERAQLAAPVPHRTAFRGGLLITGRRIHDEPRIPSRLADSQVVALPGAAGAGWRGPGAPTLMA